MHVLRVEGRRIALRGEIEAYLIESLRVNGLVQVALLLKLIHPWHQLPIQHHPAQ